MPNSANIFEIEVGKLPANNIAKSTLKGCCAHFYALASEESAKIGLNDHFLVVHKRSSISDSVTFSIKKCGSGNVLPNLGTSISFPQDNLAVGFQFDWKQYLSAYDVGVYEISKSTNVFGVPFEEKEATIHLERHNELTSSGRFRIRSTINSLVNYRGVNIDFTGSNASDTLRLKGKFGNWKANTKTKELITKGYKSERVTSINDNTYLLEPKPLLYQFSDRLINLHLFAQNESFITDDNSGNHRGDYQEKEVVFVSESLEQDEKENYQVITAEFSDRYKSHQSRHNKK